MSPDRTRRPVKRALVVQDDPTNAYLLVRLLTRWGYEVVQVADAQQAMQQASSGGFGLVLVDNVWPPSRRWTSAAVSMTWDPICR